MAPCTYSMKQDSFWREEEWEFLERAVLDVEIQEYVAKKEYNHARALLGTHFRAVFTGPTSGEKEEAFKKRLRWTRKARKALVVHRRAETLEEWQARMAQLNDRLAQWLNNWRSRGRRKAGTRWNPPAIGAPKLHKPHKQTAFDVFCKSDDAPKGSDFLSAEGRRCDLSALNAARAAAWQALSPDEQSAYVATAQETFDGAEGPSDPTAEQPAHHASDGRVATAEAIVTYVDEFVQVMHNDVHWGGFVILGGPDHTGEACIHSQTAGTNRHGQTFLDALLQVIGWTPLDFDTVFSLWLEQCRQGPQDADDRTFAEAARRAIEHSRAQAVSPSVITLNNNLDTRGAVGGTSLGSAFSAAPAQSVPDAAAVVEALNRLTLVIQPRPPPVAESPEAPRRMDTPLDETVHGDVDHAPPLPAPIPAPAVPSPPAQVVPSPPAQVPTATAPGPVLGPALPILELGTPYTQIDGQILEALLGSPGLSMMGGYDLACPLSNLAITEDAMDWGRRPTKMKFRKIFGETEGERAGHRKYYDHDLQHHVVPVYSHKGIMGPQRMEFPRGGGDKRLWAFFPEEGKWIVLNQSSDLRVHPDATYTIVRFRDIHFLPGFGEALTKASAVWIHTHGGGACWPPEEEAKAIIIHGVGNRIVRVVFWARDASLPTEFALRMDEGDNIEPVLYDALARRLNYHGEIDFWNIAETSWFRLPKEVSWHLSPRYTTFCIRASEGVRLTPGLGWEITQLERQHGGPTRDVGTDVEGLDTTDNQAD